MKNNNKIEEKKVQDLIAIQLQMNELVDKLLTEIEQVKKSKMDEDEYLKDSDRMMEIINIRIDEIQRELHAMGVLVLKLKQAELPELLRKLERLFALYDGIEDLLAEYVEWKKSQNVVHIKSTSDKSPWPKIWFIMSIGLTILNFLLLQPSIATFWRNFFQS